MFKFVILVALCLTATSAGHIGFPLAYSSYAAAPAVTYSSPAIVKTAAVPAAVSYSNFASAPVAYSSPAIVKTAVPAAYSAFSAHPVPLAYSAPAW
ncbi:vitelline membrane protein Vm26Ab-like [Phymastichus coffea]|uniref:vitelline membrane protein Vm26Ab-like n=1 Tax=Phymastichus coffea TaxID=108790 RepID=UPI00273B2F97|nr:vitelline membrane protein Vm26Ab-like [Phymastichus coffea]